jgi:hypothetical protein
VFRGRKEETWKKIMGRGRGLEEGEGKIKRPVEEDEGTRNRPGR